MDLHGNHSETWFKCQNFKNGSHHGLARKIWHEQEKIHSKSGSTTLDMAYLWQKVLINKG